MEETSLSDDEKNVIQKKYQSKQVLEMSDEEISLWSKSILLKIHVITGWTIPASEEFLNILKDQFTKNLIEKYPALNFDEIEYAFRSRNTTIEDWGKAMNLTLIDKILQPYLNERLRISESERQIAFFKRKKEFNFEKDIDWRRLIEEDYQRFIFNPKFQFVPPPHYYQVLEEDGLMPKRYYKYRLDMYQKRFPEVETKKLFELSRNRSVIELFRSAKRQHAHHLYVYQPDTVDSEK